MSRRRQPKRISLRDPVEPKKLCPLVLKKRGTEWDVIQRSDNKRLASLRRLDRHPDDNDPRWVIVGERILYATRKSAFGEVAFRHGVQL